jgi:hypothetical protein
MELFDYFFQVLMANVDNLRTEELMSIHWSLIKAVEVGQYKELYQDGKFVGFVTWEIRPNEIRYAKIDIGITNLVIIKKARGTYSLMSIINYLRQQYPNVASFVWQNRKLKELKEFKQRGKYVEDIKETVQSTW